MTIEGTAKVFVDASWSSTTEAAATGVGRRNVDTVEGTSLLLPLPLRQFLLKSKDTSKDEI